MHRLKVNVGRRRGPKPYPPDTGHLGATTDDVAARERRAARVVVIVDDDPAVCSALKFALEIEGFRVVTYSDGAALLRDTERPHDGCFVVDYYLPGMNGLDLIGRLREQRPGVPAILITSQPFPWVLRKAAMESVPIVEKPLLGNTLLDSIRTLLAPGSAKH